MKIEGNQKELDAMAEFHKGNRAEGLRLQEEFAAEFREEYKVPLCAVDRAALRNWLMAAAAALPAG